MEQLVHHLVVTVYQANIKINLAKQVVKSAPVQQVNIKMSGVKQVVNLALLGII